MKKKVLSLLAAATLCMGLMVVPFHASAATPIRDDINGISCYASVSTSSTYASALTQYKNGSHTYIQILGASGNHYIRYGNLFFNPPGGTSTGTP